MLLLRGMRTATNMVIFQHMGAASNLTTRKANPHDFFRCWGFRKLALLALEIRRTVAVMALLRRFGGEFSAQLVQIDSTLDVSAVRTVGSFEGKKFRGIIRRDCCLSQGQRPRRHGR